MKSYIRETSIKLLELSILFDNMAPNPKNMAKIAYLQLHVISYPFVYFICHGSSELKPRDDILCFFLDKISRLFV